MCTELSVFQHRGFPVLGKPRSRQTESLLPDGGQPREGVGYPVTRFPRAQRGKGPAHGRSAEFRFELVWKCPPGPSPAGEVCQAAHTCPRWPSHPNPWKNLSVLLQLSDRPSRSAPAQEGSGLIVGPARLTCAFPRQNPKTNPTRPSLVHQAPPVSVPGPRMRGPKTRQPGA